MELLPRFEFNEADAGCAHMDEWKKSRNSLGTSKLFKEYFEEGRQKPKFQCYWCGGGIALTSPFYFCYLCRHPGAVVHATDSYKCMQELDEEIVRIQDQENEKEDEDDDSNDDDDSSSDKDSSDKDSSDKDNSGDDNNDNSENDNNGNNSDDDNNNESQKKNKKS